MKPILHVLSFGLSVPLDMAYGALLLGCQCELTIVRDYRELYAIPTNEHYEIAVLGEHLSKERLTDAAQLIRRSWPCAAILVVSAQPSVIEDALYDNRVSPSLDRAMLITEVCRLARGQLSRRGCGLNVWEC